MTYYHRTCAGWGQTRPAVWSGREEDARVFEARDLARAVARECRRQGQSCVAVEPVGDGWRISVEYGPGYDRRTRWLQSGAEAPPWVGVKTT